MDSQPCHNCLGIGRKPCKDCAGAGNVSIFARPSGEKRINDKIPKSLFFFFFSPDRKFAGCVMDLVIVTEMIGAPTAVAEEEKSKHKPQISYF